jgi:hypothetical protein
VRINREQTISSERVLRQMQTSFITETGKVIPGRWPEGEMAPIIFDNRYKCYIPVFKGDRPGAPTKRVFDMIPVGKRKEVKPACLSLVFYKIASVVNFVVIDLKNVSLIDPLKLKPKVAADAGFSISGDEPFWSLHWPFTYKERTLHYAILGIKLTGDTIMNGGTGGSPTEQHHYIYDPDKAKYFHLADATGYLPVFNVGNQIYISIGGAVVKILDYADGVVTLVDTKYLPGEDPFFISSDGKAYFKEDSTETPINIYSSVVDAPLIRSLSGIKICVLEAIPGKEYQVVLNIFDYDYVGSPHYFYESQIGIFTYTAIEGDTTNSIAAALAALINARAHPPYSYFPATSDGNLIMITEDITIDMMPSNGLQHLGTVSLSGPMALLDYYPFLFESGLMALKVIKTFDLSNEAIETIFTEFTSKSSSGEWNLKSWLVPSSGSHLNAVIKMNSASGEDPPSFIDSYSADLVAKRKHEKIELGASGPSLSFIDEDVVVSAYQNCDFSYSYVSGHETIDADTNEVISISKEASLLASFQESLTKHSTRHMENRPGDEWYYNYTLDEIWNMVRESGDFNVINFPFPISGATTFYEIYKTGWTVDTEGKLIYITDGALPPVFELTRGNGPAFVASTNKLTTPYEVVDLPTGRHFSYGWCHLQDNARNVLVQGLQLQDNDGLYPILYSDGIRIENTLAEKLGVTPGDILGIIYYPLLRRN